MRPRSAERRPAFVATRAVMGTVASIHVHDDAAPEQISVAVDGVFAELERLESMFSTYRSDSEISAINAGSLSPTTASPEVVDVLDACTWLEHASNGSFDIRPDGAGGRLDPAGFVKGWAAERSAGALVRCGLEHWYVSVGGDVLVHGEPSPGEQWSVGIADPHRPGCVRATLRVAAGAVATSGTAERGLHLWDPATGTAAEDFASVTVIGPSLTWADAFATVAFVKGAAGLAWIEGFADYHAVAVHHDGTVECTSAVRC